MSTAWNHSAGVASALCCFVLSSGSAWAEVTSSDMQIAGRALSFLQKPLTGDVRIGIVYVASDAQSVREAENLQLLLKDGLKIGNLTLRPVLVAATEAGQASVDIFFLTPGMGTAAKSVGAASGAKHVPCVTTDLAQVMSGTCAMGVRSKPKVEILVNRTAAAASRTAFSTVFRMMITEI